MFRLFNTLLFSSYFLIFHWDRWSGTVELGGPFGLALSIVDTSFLGIVGYMDPIQQALLISAYYLHGYVFLSNC